MLESERERERERERDRRYSEKKNLEVYDNETHP